MCKSSQLVVSLNAKCAPHLYCSLNDEFRSVIEGFCSQLYDSRISLCLRLINIIVYVLLMSREFGMNKLFVQNRTALGHRTQQPKHNAHLRFIIERKPAQKNVTKCFYELKASHHNPVHHPSHILFNIFRPNGFITAVGWIEDSKY